MARSNRIRPSVYFGRPGSLVTMPYPRGDIDKPYDRMTFDFVTGSGQHMISSMAQGSRPYTLTWNALHLDTFAKIEQYSTGQMGVGPWVLIDPSVGNLLLPNQASASNTLMDTTGWKTITGASNEGTLISNTGTSFIHRTGAIRSIRWQFTVTAATTPILTFNPPYRNWFGFPVAASLPYTFSLWARPDGVVDSSIQMSARVRWFDSAGAQISEVSGGNVTVTSFTQLSVSSTSPSNAAYCLPLLASTGATITTGGSIYVDEPLFEQDSVVNSWVPGTGVRPVEILGLSEVSPFDARFRKSIALTLRELVA